MFGLFQCVMPLLGFFLGYSVISYIEKFVPWIALLVLGFLGGKMIIEAVKKKDDDADQFQPLTFFTLFIQSIATSIDALSVGLTIADYAIKKAIFCSLIIGCVTFAISLGSVYIGKKFGTKLENKAAIIGGIILICIGIEIFLTGIL